MRRIVLAVPLLVLLAPPPVAAQAPECATISLAHAEVPSIDPGATRDVVFSVKNNHNVAQVNATVFVNLASDYAAAGWDVAPAEQWVVVDAGQTGSVTVTVTTPDRSGDSAMLNARANGRCSVQGRTLPVPVGPDVVPEVTDSVQLATTAPGGLPFPGLDALANVPAVYLFGGLIVVVVALGAVIAARRRGDGFDAGSPEPEKAMLPGRGASFPIDVKNRGRQPDTARFEVGDVPHGWTAFLAVSEVTLAPGEGRTLWLMVRAPPEAAEGSATVVPLTVRSKSNPKREARVAVRAEVRGGGPAEAGEAGATSVG